jgi:WD40 repeat protein
MRRSPVFAVVFATLLWSNGGVWSQTAPAAPAIPAILLGTFKGHTSSIQCTAVSPDGGLVATGAADKTLRLWNTQDGSECFRLTFQNTCASVSFSADGSRLVAAGGEQVVVVDPRAAKSVKTLFAPAAVTQVGISADGKIVQASGARLQGSVSGGKVVETFRDAWATVWDVATEKELLAVKDAVPRGGFAPGGNTMALMDATGSICLWNIAANASMATVHADGGRIVAAAFSPDGKLFAAGNYAGGRGDNGDDKTLRIWETATGRERQALAGHLKGIYGLTFSADGRRLWASDYNGDQKLWDVEKGVLLSRLEQVKVDGRLQGMPVGYWAVSDDFLHWASGSSLDVLWYDIKDFAYPSGGVPVGKTTTESAPARGTGTGGGGVRAPSTSSTVPSEVVRSRPAR